jgi:hypothetical protein
LSFTPLVSPVLTPQVNLQHLSLSQPHLSLSQPHFNHLSPLNSPALNGFGFNFEPSNLQLQPSASEVQNQVLNPVSSYQIQNPDGSITPMTLVPLTPSQLMFHLQSVSGSQQDSNMEAKERDVSHSQSSAVDKIEENFVVPKKRNLIGVSKRQSASKKDWGLESDDRNEDNDDGIDVE